MSWFLVGGAAVGAGVGSYGHDNWGWSKNAIWMGGVAGAAGGVAMAPAGSTTALGFSGGGLLGGAAPAATGGPQTFAGASQAFGESALTGFAPGNISGAIGGGGGMNMGSALMLGSAGMGLMSGMQSSGPAFQDDIKISDDGKELQKGLTKSVKARMKKALGGDVSDKAFADISRAKIMGQQERRASDNAVNTAAATVGNAPKESRGIRTLGGGFNKAVLKDAGKSMKRYFEPASILGNYQREELFNAGKHVQNLHNIDNQVGSFAYSSDLAKWGANQNLASQRGSAIGTAAMMMGGHQRNEAYLNRTMKIAGN